MRSLAVEGELGRDQRRLQKPIARRELGTNMVVERDIDIVEPAVADEIRPADELLLRRPAEHLEGAAEAEALHRLLGRDRGRDQHGGIDVMTFAMAGCTFDNEALLGHTGGLRVVRATVVLGMDRDDRMAGAVACAEAGRKARDAALDFEPRLLE